MQSTTKTVAIEHGNSGIGEVFNSGQPAFEGCLLRLIIGRGFVLGTDGGDGVNVVTG